jgi:UDP-N-acetylglucosamine 2-epimerase (non-hydrolysing)
MMLICFGTRPEYIKIKPLLAVFDGHIDYALLFTGQHTDLLKNLPRNTRRIKIIDGPNRLDSIVQSILNKEELFEEVTSVLVQGDTTSVFSLALAAFHRQIRVIHLEAGLRTYDKWNPYPEEFNRQAVSRIADIHLCPTELAAENLQREGISDNVFVSGNTVLDNIRDVCTEYEDTVVVTMHRRENHHWIDQWFREINSLAIKNPSLEFILPIHPNPNVRKHKEILTDVKVVSPLEYNRFIELLAKAKLVITDSGGIQEETSFFFKKCIVCRKATERSEGLGVFSFLCETPDKLEGLFNAINDDHIPTGICPYGDGFAAESILEYLHEQGF